MMNMIYAIDGWRFLWWSYGVPCPVFTFFGCFGLLKFQENIEFLFKKVIFLKLFDWFEFSSKSKQIERFELSYVASKFWTFFGSIKQIDIKKFFFWVFAGVSNKFYFFTLKSPSSGVFFFGFQKEPKSAQRFLIFEFLSKMAGLLFFLYGTSSYTSWQSVHSLWNFLIYILAI